MKEWYKFNRDAIKAIKENPNEAIQCTVFFIVLFGCLWGALWIHSIASGSYV